MALIAALSSPLFGFTPDELAAIRIQGDGGEPFYDCLERAAEGDGRCRAFLDTLGALRALARDAELSELLQEVYARLDVFALCSAMPDGEARRAQLARLFELAKRFEATLWRGLHRFLGWLCLLEERGAEPMGAEAAEGGAVTVMSIHRSKGLEFPIVLLCDTARRFNRQDTAGAVLMHPELGLGPRLTDAARGIEYPTIARRAIARRTERETLSEEMRLGVEVRTPLFAQLVCRGVGLAAAGVGADVGLRVGGVHRARAAEDETARGHGLGLQGVRSKSAGISAATTPGRYEAMSTVCTSPSMRTVNTVSASAPGAAEGSSGAAPGASSSGRARAMTRQTSAAATIVFMAVPPVLDLCRQKGIQCFDSGSAAGIFYMDRNGIYA